MILIHRSPWGVRSGIESSWVGFYRAGVEWAWVLGLVEEGG